MRTKTKAAVFGAIITAGCGVFLLATALGDGLVCASYDLPFRFRPVIHAEEAVMVYLDDASHEKLHQKYLEPWNRALFTQLLNRLTADGAKAVVFDIVFSDPLEPATDQAFANAMETNGKVVLGADEVLMTVGAHGAAATQVSPPARIFNDSAADLGLTATYANPDMEVRTYAPTPASGGGSMHPISSEAWAGAVLANPVLLANKSLQNSMFWLNYYGPELLAIPSVSLYQAVADSDPNAPRGYFSNKVVFVGERLMTQPSDTRKDQYASPYSWLPGNRFMSGVTIHATACLNLIRGDYLRRLGAGTERIIVLLLGSLIGAGLVSFRPLPAILIALLSAVVIALVDDVCFVEWHYWFPFLIPIMVQIPVALIWSVASGSMRLYLELCDLRKRVSELERSAGGAQPRSLK
jgi:CHASE2 domain-containing sensor protein